jgi:hypothetical protein
MPKDTIMMLIVGLLGSITGETLQRYLRPWVLHRGGYVLEC